MEEQVAQLSLASDSQEPAEPEVAASVNAELEADTPMTPRRFNSTTTASADNNNFEGDASTPKASTLQKEFATRLQQDGSVTPKSTPATSRQGTPHGKLATPLAKISTPRASLSANTYLNVSPKTVISPNTKTTAAAALKSPFNTVSSKSNLKAPTASTIGTQLALLLRKLYFICSF